MLAYALFHPLKKITLWRVRREAESNLIRWNCTATKVKIKKVSGHGRVPPAKTKSKTRLKTAEHTFEHGWKWLKGILQTARNDNIKTSILLFFCARSGPQRDRRQWRVSWSPNNAGRHVSLGKISSLAAEFSPFTSLISSIFLRQKVEIHFLQSCFNLQYENGAKA